MVTPVNSITLAVQNFLSPETSPTVHVFFKTLRVYHEVWWVYQRQKKYRDPKSWLYLGAGYVINHSIGQYEPVKRGFQIYTIALRVYYVIKELELLEGAWIDVMRSLKNEYPQTLSYSQKKTESRIKPYLTQAKRILQSSQHLFIILANVSARCLEVYDAFYMQNNQEIVIDILDGIQEFQAHKDSVKLRLLEITKKITPLISPTIEPQDIVNSVNTFFNSTNLSSRAYKRIKNKTCLLLNELMGGYASTKELFTSLTTPSQSLLIHSPSKIKSSG